MLVADPTVDIMSSRIEDTPLQLSCGRRLLEVDCHQLWVLVGREWTSASETSYLRLSFSLASDFLDHIVLRPGEAAHCL